MAKYKKGDIIRASNGKFYIITLAKVSSVKCACNYCALNPKNTRKICTKTLYNLFNNESCVSLIGEHTWTDPKSYLVFTKIDKHGGGI